MENKLCEYGCGQIARYKTKSGKFICSDSPNKCGIIRNKNSEKLKIAHKSGKFLKNYFNGKQNWRKGLTKKTDERVRRNAEAVSKSQKGRIGRKHTSETKRKISEGRIQYLEKHPGYCKWFKINNGKKNISVQGTWEKKVAEHFNAKNIKWDRIRIYFSNNERCYTPDFYLPEYNLYIEVKGWMRERDKYKMHKVLNENYIDIRMIEDLNVLNELTNDNIFNLEKFENKYPENKIDFTKFDKKTIDH